MKVRVKILQNRFGGGRRVYTAGNIVELDAHKAEQAVKAGWARYEQAPPRPVAVVETMLDAAAEERETAVSPKRKTRKKR